MIAGKRMHSHSENMPLISDLMGRAGCSRSLEVENFPQRALVEWGCGQSWRKKSDEAHDKSFLFLPGTSPEPKN